MAFYLRRDQQCQVSITREEAAAIIVCLARTFPALARAPLDPWSSSVLDAWAAQPRLVEQRLAAQFVLSIWNQDKPWRCGRFNPELAHVWTGANGRAFAEWARCPWWL